MVSDFRDFNFKSISITYLTSVTYNMININFTCTYQVYKCSNKFGEKKYLREYMLLKIWHPNLRQGIKNECMVFQNELCADVSIFFFIEIAGLHKY